MFTKMHSPKILTGQLFLAPSPREMRRSDLTPSNPQTGLKIQILVEFRANARGQGRCQGAPEGSVNVDLTFQLTALPAVGETVLTPKFTEAIGGKRKKRSVVASADAAQNIRQQRPAPYDVGNLAGWCRRLTWTARALQDSLDGDFLNVVFDRGKFENCGIVDKTIHGEGPVFDSDFGNA
jgi:hypothetical protein